MRLTPAQAVELELRVEAALLYLDGLMPELLDRDEDDRRLVGLAYISGLEEVPSALRVQALSECAAAVPPSSETIAEVRRLLGWPERDEDWDPEDFQSGCG